jgi:CubicO group peptidase (beta-lactamase class C family)
MQFAKPGPVLMALALATMGAPVSAGSDAPPAPPGQQAVDEVRALADALDQRLAGTFDGDRPGLTLSISQGGRTLMTRSYGMANWEHSIPWTPQTRYTFYSVTKSMVSAAIVTLERQGKLRFDQSITDLLPGLPEGWAAITVDHLIRHRTGLFQDETLMYMTGTGLAEDPLPVSDLRALVEMQDTPNPAPGTHFSYSDSAMRLAARLVEQVHSKPFAQAMHELVFAPAGMVSTRIVGTEPVRDRGRASSYVRMLLHEASANGEAYRVMGSPVESTGDGGAVGSVEDLSAFLRHISASRPDGPSLMETMTEPLRNSQVAIEGAYRRSLALHGYRGIEYFAHGGYLGKRIAYLPEQKIGIAFMTNQNDGPGTREIMRMVIDALIDAKLAAEGQPGSMLELSKDEQAALTGIFVEPLSGVVLQLQQSGEGQLFDQPIQIERTGEGGFRTGRYDETEALFRIGANGELEMLQADWGSYRPLKRQSGSHSQANLSAFEGAYQERRFGSVYYLRQCGDTLRLQIGVGLPSAHQLDFRAVSQDVLATIEGDRLSDTMGGPYTLRRASSDGANPAALLLTHNSVRSLVLEPVAQLPIPAAAAHCVGRAGKE